MVRYCGLYAKVHRWKVRKAGLSPFVLRMLEEEEKRIPSKGLRLALNRGEAAAVAGLR